MTKTLYEKKPSFGDKVRRMNHAKEATGVEVKDRPVDVETITANEVTILVILADVVATAKVKAAVTEVEPAVVTEVVVAEVASERFHRRGHSIVIAI